MVKKNPTPGCNLGPKFPPHAVHLSKKKKWRHSCPSIKKSMTNYTLLKEIKQTYLEKRTLVKNFSCRIQYSFYDEQPHGVGPDQNMKVQANGGMKYPIS